MIYVYNNIYDSILQQYKYILDLDLELVKVRANSAHIRQSRPDSGLGFQVKVLQTFRMRPPARVLGMPYEGKQGSHVEHATTSLPSSGLHGAQYLAHMRKGSASFGACEVRCWRWLFGNEIAVSYHRPLRGSRWMCVGGRWFWGTPSGKPSTLNPQTSTLNPKP